MNFKIVSLALNIPGPLVCAALAAKGCTVLKIEPPQGDPLQHVCKAWYQEIHQSQKIVALDLKSENGREELWQHLQVADLLITSSRTATLARLELDSAHVRARCPHLSQLAIVGEFSPRHNVAGHDLTYQAQVGLLTSTEHLPRVLLADQMGAAVALSEALHLLMQKALEGVVNYREVSLYEAAQTLNKPFLHGLTRTGAVLGGGLAHYGVYQARQGFVAFAALEEKFLLDFKKQLQIEKTDHATLRQIFLERTADEWQVWAQQHDIPLVKIVVAC